MRKSIKFSLVLATRQRTALLRNLLHSLREKTADKSSIEVLAVCDNDDGETCSIIDKWQQEWADLNLRFLPRLRSRMLNEDCINYASRISTGEFIFVLNDDVVFLTDQWDEIAYSALSSYLSNKNDGIVYAMPDDGLQAIKTDQKCNYACFPIVSRQCLEVLKYVMHPTFPTWGADLHLFRVYAAVDRVCDLLSVKLLHDSYHAGTRPRDVVSFHVEAIQGKMRPLTFDINDDVRKLLHYIHGIYIPSFEPFEEKVVITRQGPKKMPASQMTDAQKRRHDIYTKRINRLRGI